MNAMDAISRILGRDEMAFVGETPWHGKGQNLAPGQPLEVWLAAAGMNWQVQRSKVRFAVAHGAAPESFKAWDDKIVLFRSDTKSPLGLVSDSYKVVQPRQVLEFFTEFAHINGLELETAGTLHGGARYWALANTSKVLNVAGIDPVKGYVMLATSADGSMATTADFTSVRVVCQNTLNIALSSKSDKVVRVKHSTTFKAKDVLVNMGLMDDAWAQFSDNVTKLASARITKGQAASILISAIGDADKFQADLPTIGAQKAMEAQPNLRVMGEILDLFGGKMIGANMMTTENTAWGLVNAATEYFDHHAGRSQDTRLASAWHGTNATRKTDIMAKALELVNA
jgi:phage/plasmid-like protein (TIGR03299 family)